ncbi:hypothetical protein ACXYMX_00435 [Sporosarcina sp. CAU 1771]
MNIQSILAKATSAVEFMNDKMVEIQRYVEYRKPSGADGQRWEPIHTDVPCRLSSVKLDNTVQGDGNQIQYDTKLFLSPAVEVKAGDRMAVNGVKYESAKEPFVYISHQEVLLIRKEWA